MSTAFLRRALTAALHGVLTIYFDDVLGISIQVIFQFQMRRVLLDAKSGETRHPYLFVKAVSCCTLAVTMYSNVTT